MALTRFLLAALLAASAIASPAALSTPAQVQEKREDSGLDCQMHIVQKTYPAMGGDERYATVDLKDVNGKVVHHESFGKYDKGFKVGEGTFDDPIEFTRHGKGDGDTLKGHTQGFWVKWGDNDEFDTNTRPDGRCSIGDESVSAYMKSYPSILALNAVLIAVL